MQLSSDQHRPGGIPLRFFGMVVSVIARSYPVGAKWPSDVGSVGRPRIVRLCGGRIQAPPKVAKNCTAPEQFSRVRLDDAGNAGNRNLRAGVGPTSGPAVQLSL